MDVITPAFDVNLREGTQVLKPARRSVGFHSVQSRYSLTRLRQRLCA